MKTLTTDQVKTQLLDLLKEVDRGEILVFGEHGQPAYQLKEFTPEEIPLRVNDLQLIADLDKTMRLVQTSSAAPEQYDALDQQDNVIGYLRLRNGSFRVHFPDVGGKVIYEANPAGSIIFGDNERRYYLQKAIKAIKMAMESDK